MNHKIRSKISTHKSRVDLIYLTLTLLLTVYGSVMIYTAGSYYSSFRYSDPNYFIKRHLLWVGIGIAVMCIISNLDIKRLFKICPSIYAITLALLAITLIIGSVGNGAKRWISIGPITIQPSEIAKLSVILILSYYFSSETYLKKNGKSVFIYDTIIPCTIILIPIILIMLQKHLSCIIIVGLIGISMIVLCGANIRYLSYFAAIGSAGAMYIALFTDYTKDRLMVWQNPDKYKLTGGWQTLQGLMAIGSGGLFGKGLGKGELKLCYVSEPANDMIFAILCEELGLIGVIIAFTLFALLIRRGFIIANRCSNQFLRNLCFGITSKIAIQTLLNIAVVTNMLPNTGISLPFFSYGGSSIFILFVEIGIILAASKDIILSNN